LPPPAAPKSKNLNWLDGQLGKFVVDCLSLGKDLLAPSVGTMLTNNQVEAGIAHSLWSVLPGKVAVISSAWLTICVEANTKGDFALLPEDFYNLSRQRDTVCKSELILCPILVQEPVKHWTLLVLERSMPAAATRKLRQRAHCLAALPAGTVQPAAFAVTPVSSRSMQTGSNGSCCNFQ